MRSPYLSACEPENQVTFISIMRSMFVGNATAIMKKWLAYTRRGHSRSRTYPIRSTDDKNTNFIIFLRRLDFHSMVVPCHRTRYRQVTTVHDQVAASSASPFGNVRSFQANGTAHPSANSRKLANFRRSLVILKVEHVCFSGTVSEQYRFRAPS
jgi:hypothetical protein